MKPVKPLELGFFPRSEASSMAKPSAGRSPLPIRDAIGSCMGAASSPEQGVGAGFVGENLGGKPWVSPVRDRLFSADVLLTSLNSYIWKLWKMGTNQEISACFTGNHGDFW